MTVLVLNASYEPLGIVSVPRAVTLVVTGRAVTELDSDVPIRSATMELFAPSVIRLTRMVHAPRKRSVPLSRKALFARDAGACQYCGVPAATIDHVLPRSRGGRHTWENVVACCLPCNARKADRTPDEAGMPLMSRPWAPTRVAMLGSRGRPEWTKYLSQGG